MPALPLNFMKKFRMNFGKHTLPFCLYAFFLGRISVIAYTRLTLTKSQKAKWMEKKYINVFKISRIDRKNR